VSRWTGISKSAGALARFMLMEERNASIEASDSNASTSSG